MQPEAVVSQEEVNRHMARGTTLLQDAAADVSDYVLSSGKWMERIGRLLAEERGVAGRTTPENARAMVFVLLPDIFAEMHAKRVRESGGPRSSGPTATSEVIEHATVHQKNIIAAKVAADVMAGHCP